MGLLNKLDAINYMLIFAGESPVSDLENASGIDTEIADKILESCSLDFQLRGLAGSRVTHTLRPNSAGEIELPTVDNSSDGLISASLKSLHVNSDNRMLYARVYEGQPPKLYNTVDETLVWPDGDYSVEIIRYIKWDQLETTSQRAVLASAARLYQIITQGDGDTDVLLGTLENRFVSTGRGHDIALRRRNLFMNSDLLLQRATFRRAYYDYQSPRYPPI